MTRLGTPLLALVAVVAILVAADVGIVALRLTSGHPVGRPVASAPHPSTGGHPCNHGYYVSQAAHAKHNKQNQPPKPCRPRPSEAPAG